MIKRARGRPKGSKNKSKLNDEALEIKQGNTLFSNTKEIKKEIRALRKLKLQCRAGTSERLELEHKIKALKKQKVDLSTPEPEKDNLIAEIKKLDPLFETLEIDLKKFTIKELEYHLNKITKKSEVK